MINMSKEDKRLQYQETLQQGLEDLKRVLSQKKDLELIEKGQGQLEKEGMQWGLEWLEILRICVQSENKSVM